LKKLFLALCFFPLFVISLESQAETVPLRIATASDLKFAMEEVVKAYASAHADQDVTPIYGASGNLTTQIQQGAPFDIFLSADTGFPEFLMKNGKADGSPFAYSVGHIVLWVPNESKLDLSKGPSLLLSKEIKKVAIANPLHAPYGRAAEEALTKVGLYEKINTKIVMGANIAQTAQFVETKAADIGIIAVSLALSPTLKKDGRYIEIDQSLYSKMIQSGVLVKSSSHLKEAREFRDFILSDKGQKILHEFGMGSTKVKM
jgi:molybdate transport system substrate-binding protein